MAISRVDFGGRTLIDLTGDTVTAKTLMVGSTAHGANGEPIQGEATSSEPVIINDLITGKQMNLKKITLSSSNPPSNYQWEEGEIWITYTTISS